MRSIARTVELRQSIPVLRPLTAPPVFSINLIYLAVDFHALPCPAVKGVFVQVILVSSTGGYTLGLVISKRPRLKNLNTFYSI